MSIEYQHELISARRDFHALDLPAALDRLRAGGDSRPLINSLRLLAFKDSGIRPPIVRTRATEGAAYLSIAAAVERLRYTPASDPLQYIINAIRRNLREHRTEDSMTINPPYSVNAKRKHRGEPEYPRLSAHQFARYLDGDGEEHEWEPIDYRNSDIEQFISCDCTPLEQTVIGCRRIGLTEQQIANSMGVTRHQIRNILRGIRERWVA